MSWPLNPWIIIAAAVALLAAYAAGYNTGGNLERQRWQAKQIAAEQTARMTERLLAKKLEDARNEATERETRNRAAVAAAHRAAAGLRDTVGNLRRQLSAASAEACRNTADAALTVFGECGNEYRALAEVADRHANDAMTCLAGWPERN